MKMKLDDVKKELAISDGTVGQRLKALIQDESDCFGVEWSPISEECKLCNITTSIRGMNESLWFFCEEITRTGELEVSNDEVEKVLKIFKKFKEEGRPDHEWSDYLRSHRQSSKEQKIDRDWHWFPKRRMLRVEVE